MKKFLAVFLLVASSGAMAQHIHNHYHGGYRGGWVAPFVVGNMIGHSMHYHDTVIVQQPSVIVQQPQTIVVPSAPPPGYHWQQMINPQTNQIQLVLVPN